MISCLHDSDDIFVFLRRILFKECRDMINEVKMIESADQTQALFTRIKYKLCLHESVDQIEAFHTNRWIKYKRCLRKSVDQIEALFTRICGLNTSFVYANLWIKYKLCLRESVDQIEASSTRFCGLNSFVYTNLWIKYEFCLHESVDQIRLCLQED